METKILKLELNNVETVSTYGGSKTIVEYSLITVCENIQNVYTVVGEIRGIATADLYMNFVSASSLTNNENTLIESAIEDLLNW
jgi:hypothetical protein